MDERDILRSVQATIEAHGDDAAAHVTRRYEDLFEQGAYTGALVLVNRCRGEK